MSQTDAGAGTDAATAVRPTDASGWQPLLELAELEAAHPVPVPVRCAGEPWALVLLDGQPRALYDVCPHRRVPLSAGKVVPGPAGEVLECGYHGWSYDGRGSCARIPALGEDIVPRGMGSVRVLHTAVCAGLVWGSSVDVAPPATQRPLVAVPGGAQTVSLTAATVQASLDSARGEDGIFYGRDPGGAFAYALGAPAAGQVTLFPMSSSRRPDDSAAWAARLAALAVTASQLTSPVPEARPDHVR